MANSFIAPRIPNPTYTRNFTLAMAKTYAKYNMRPLSSQKQKRGGEMSALSGQLVENAEYLCNVTIGGQSLLMSVLSFSNCLSSLSGFGRQMSQTFEVQCFQAS
jgi:hypothetical protein